MPWVSRKRYKKNIACKPGSLRKHSRLSKVLCTLFIHQGINKALDMLEGKHMAAWGCGASIGARRNPARTCWTNCSGGLETCPHGDTRRLATIWRPIPPQPSAMNVSSPRGQNCCPDMDIYGLSDYFSLL